MTLPAEYFDAMYARSPDPWSFRDRWYEERKRDLTLAALPARRYGRVLEPGCSIGLLTQALAGRCDALLALDTSEAAVASARAALTEHPHVRVETRVLPCGWPRGEPSYDLVVLSEVGYYFDAADLATVVDLAVRSLAADGTLLACHWRHPVADYPLSGDDVHAAIARRPELHRVVRHEEPDLLLEVFTVGAQPSVAAREGLVA
jgi:SAM-dependent methyltransferase